MGRESSLPVDRPGSVRVRVCRDCCCGSRLKHPKVDHDGILKLFIDGTRGSAEVIRSACLNQCDSSNVVVVVPSTVGRAQGGKPVWFEGVLDRFTANDIVAFVNAGGPGLAEPRAKAERAVMRNPGPTSLVMSTFGGPR